MIPLISQRPCDAKTIEHRIYLREERIRHLELEILQITDKIAIMKHEIEEYKRLLN